MDNVVGVAIVFTDNYIMPKKQFQLRGGISKDLEPCQTPKIKDYDIVKAVSVDETDFGDFPDLGKPLPEVSLGEQMRLSSVTRGKILSWQLGQQQHFLDMWHQAQECNQESSVD